MLIIESVVSMPHHNLENTARLPQPHSPSPSPLPIPQMAVPTVRRLPSQTAPAHTHLFHAKAVSHYLHCSAGRSPHWHTAAVLPCTRSSVTIYWRPADGQWDCRLCIRPPVCLSTVWPVHSVSNYPGIYLSEWVHIGHLCLHTLFPGHHGTKSCKSPFSFWTKTHAPNCFP